MRYKVKSLVVFTALFFVPSILLAAPATIKALLELLAGIVGSVIPLVVGLAVLAFFWGLANFILQADNEEKRSDGKRLMVWGIIALFVIISVWGIVGVLTTTFFGGTPTFSDLPQE